jgi:hypothetical protein
MLQSRKDTTVGEDIVSLIAVRAHFDGRQIRLDEPCQLEPDTQLLIIILAQRPGKGEREDWEGLSLRALSNAYGEHEPEYSLDAIKQPNPEYEGR